MTERNKTISNDDELCRVFNNFFSKIVDELKISNISNYKIDNTNDPLKDALRYFENHPSIRSIKSKSFDTNFIQFSMCSKHADVIPVHKKGIKSDKVNYRPVGSLPNLSKIYEKLMYQQLHEHFNSILSPKQCGFRKGYSAQRCLMIMLEKVKESRDKGEEFGAFFTDLSKAFDSIDHNLLTTKLSWYGVTHMSIKLIFSYLSNRIQCVRINNSYSRKSEIKYGVPQGLVLGSILFNIDLIDLFFECGDDNISSYADDTTPYSCAHDISSVISELQRIIKKKSD